jgi:acetyltransferase-like isoleucine patch superfamily enzyme
MSEAPLTEGPDAARREYFETRYLQFTAGKGLKFAMRAIGVLFWPLVLPLVVLSKLSDILFRSCSEALSLIPEFPGAMIRYEFYRFALRGCGHNVLFCSGAVFNYSDITIGSHVLVGRQVIVHHCDIGDYTLIGERCTLLSGSKQHRAERTDVPMALQGGQKRRIRIEGDAWLGSHAVVMNDVGRGAIVAAGAVVVEPVPDGSIVGGVPAREIGRRSSH